MSLLKSFGCGLKRRLKGMLCDIAFVNIIAFGAFCGTRLPNPNTYLTSPLIADDEGRQNAAFDPSWIVLVP